MTSEYNYKKLVINPRVIEHLGKDLITTPDVAVVELIKNSIDAFGDDIRLHLFDTFVEINSHTTNLEFKVPDAVENFLPDSCKNTSVFIIEDNGTGMDNRHLEKGFLEIGTDIKKVEQNATLGEKGIGRLAVQRLGKSILIETASENEDYASLTFIDWDHIKGNNDEDYKVPYAKIEKVTQRYTRLWIFDINLNDYIDTPEQLAFDFGQEINIVVNTKLKSAINFLLLPFSKKSKNYAFSMYYKQRALDIKFDETMIDLSESIHRFSMLDTIEGLHLDYSLNLKPWFLERVHRTLTNPEAFKKLRQPHSYYEEMLNDNMKRINNVLTKGMSEAEIINIIAKTFQDVYQYAIKDKVTREEYSRKKAISIIEEIKKITPICGEIYSFKQNSAIGQNIIIDSIKEKYRNEDKYSLANLKKFLEENNGIKLYRDIYRIGFLGNKDNDWLELQQFRTKGQQFYRFDLGNTLGFVSINDEKQENIKEVSSRLDISENNVSHAFKFLVKIIFNKLFYELNRSSNNILRVLFEERGLLGERIRKQVKKSNNNINDAIKRNKKLAEKIEKISNEIKKINTKDENGNFIVNAGMISKVTSVLDNTAEHMHEDEKIQTNAVSILNEADEQLKKVEVEAYNNYKLMANGLITETITHELDSVCKTNNLSSADIHFDYLKEYFVERKEAGIFNRHVFPIRKNYNNVSDKMKDVGSLYTFLEKTFIKKGTYDEFENQNISEVVDNIKNNLLQASNDNIDIECRTRELSWFVPKGVLIHVFYNLFTNSIFWIDRRRKYADTDDKYKSDEKDSIVIETYNDKDIVVYDSGTGVIPDMQDILFQPLESGKPNHEGRGMGLYIVQQLLRSFSSDIKLLEDTNSYGNRYRFLIQKNAEEE